MTDFLSTVALGMSTALDPVNLLYCLIGVTLGTLVGVLPGIGSLAAVTMLLPFSFYLEPATAVVMLAGVYYGGEYGGSTAAILLNLPGTPSSAVTSLDGYPMAKAGRAGVALLLTALASFVGGSIGIILLMVLSPVLVQVANAFGPGEYLALMVLGLVCAATITQASMVKGLAMVAVGLCLGTVGTDLNTATPRFNFGIHELRDGLSLVAVAMGLFGVSEIISSIRADSPKGTIHKVTFRSMIPTRQDIVESTPAALRGSAIGSLVGVLPGVGQMVGSFLSYAVEKRVNRNPGKFGKGAVEGIAGPEAANNAAVQTSFIPTLTLGVPGSATMAIMVGALMIHGINPGPTLMTQHPALFWGLVASFWIGNLFLLILNIPLVGLWVRLLQVPYNLLYPIILALICIGIYTVNYNFFDILVVLVVGMAGYILRILDFEVAPLIIAFILGPLIEQNLRRATLLSRGDVAEAFLSPLSLGIYAATLAFVLWSYFAYRARQSTGAEPAK